MMTGTIQVKALVKAGNSGAIGSLEAWLPSARAPTLRLRDSWRRSSMSVQAVDRPALASTGELTAEGEVQSWASGVIYCENALRSS